MYQKWTKRLFGLFFTAALLLSSGVIALATPSDTDNESTKSSIQLSGVPLSEEYKNYISSGGKGPVVSPFNLDYLGESYAQQRKQTRSGKTFPTEYDLRDYGDEAPDPFVIIEVPGRPAMPEDPGIDYGTMMTKKVIPDTIGYWFHGDRSDLKRGTGEAIALTPGVTLHLVTLPTSNSFTSDIREVPVGTSSSDPASVAITFQDSDNNILKDLSYIKYYNKEGSVTETVAAPNGYNIIDEDTYVIDVTRDESGKLVATPDAIAITVEQIKTPEPEKPSEPSKPTKPGSPSNDTPSTGDATPFLPLLLLALSSLAISAGIILFKKRRRQDKE